MMSSRRGCSLAVLVIVAGCGGGGGGSADLSAPPDLAGPIHPSGTVSAPTEHRAAPSACPARPAGSVCSIPSACMSDADCTQGQGGRCQSTGQAGCACNYDQCNSDADCGAGQACACRITLRGSPAGQGPNSCVPANCLSDADCGAGGFCSPSYSDGPCASYIIGYYCHTAADECGVNADCVPDGIGYPLCAYRSDVGHWVCVLGEFCAG